MRCRRGWTLRRWLERVNRRDCWCEGRLNGGRSDSESDWKGLDVIYEIELLSFKDPYPHAFLQTLQSLNPETFFVAEHAGTPVGYIIATEDRGHGHILAIAVHQSEKRKGIGKRLILELLQTLRSLGVITVRLEGSTNTTASSTPTPLSDIMTMKTPWSITTLFNRHTSRIEPEKNKLDLLQLWCEGIP